MTSIGFCVLCGDCGKLTEEHIFAEWIGKVAPSPFKKTKAQLITTAGYKTSLIPGKHSDLGIKVLCSKCNNDWGSRLQNKTAHVLKPLIRGHWNILNSNERSQLARWLTCFVMVREFFHPELVTISASERKRFRQTSIPSRGTSMWIVPFEGTQNHLAVWHRALVGMMSSQDTSKPDTHLTVLGVSKILFFVFGTTHEEFVNEGSIFRCGVSRYLASRGMVQIWPLGPIFPGEKPPPLYDKDFDQLMLGASAALADPLPWLSIANNIQNAV